MVPVTLCCLKCILIRKLTTNCLTKQYLHFTNWMQRFRLIEKHKMYTIIYMICYTLPSRMFIVRRAAWQNKTMECNGYRDRWFAVSSANEDYNYIFIRSLFLHPLLFVGWFAVFAKGKIGVTTTQLYSRKTSTLCWRNPFWFNYTWKWFLAK